MNKQEGLDWSAYFSSSWIRGDQWSL